MQAAWDTYKTRHIVAASPGLRVQRPSDNNDTVSEGMAYGMLFAVFMNDKATFDGLWQHAQARRNSKGLLRWHYDANGTPIGSGADNAATDADEDAAFALIMADKQWGGSYLAAANTHLTSMMNNMVAGDNTLRPDDVNSGDVNPSYFAPAYYRVFAQASGNSRWMQVLDRSYTLLELCAHDTTGLVPDWCTTGGSAARNSRYGYDAARTPWRIAQDACWYNEARAKSLPRARGDVLQGRRAERDQGRLQPGRNQPRHVRVADVRRSGGQRGDGGQRRLHRVHAPDLRPGRRR